MQNDDRFSAMVADVSRKIGRPLDEQEENDFDLFLKGRALANVTPTEGWAIAITTLEQIKNDCIEGLLRTQPGDNEKVLAAHGVAYGASEMYHEFMRAIDAAVNAPYPEFVEQTSPEMI
jgi:hypothetical protein